MSRSPTTPFNYSVPVGTTAVSGQVISSSAYNNFLSDLTNNLANAAWPTTYGGTGTTDGSSLVPDGSTATPAFRFQNETNTGFYRAAAGQIGVSVLGTNVGTFTASGLSITNPISISGSTVGFTPFTGISTEAAAAAGPITEMYRNSASPAANDVIGQWKLTGQNSTPAKVTYAFDQGIIVSPTAGAEYGAVDHYAKVNGTDTRTFSTGPVVPNTPQGFMDGYATTATAAGTTTLTAASAKNQYFTGTSTQTVVLPVVSSTGMLLGWQSIITNNSTGAVTVQSSGANTILVVGPGQRAIFTCISLSGTTAASWDFKAQGIFYATAVASTSGTTIDYTGIPAGVKMIWVEFKGVSWGTNTNPMLQIGAGSVTTSGYVSAAGEYVPTASFATSTAGFIGAGSAAGLAVSGNNVYGLWELRLQNISGTWVYSSNLSASTSTTETATGAGYLALGGTLDRVRITSSTGATFDAGEVGLAYSF